MDYSEKDVENLLINHGFDFEDINIVAQQYQTEYGVIDLLGYDLLNKNLVVVEIKKGLVDENAVGQIMRYIAGMKDLVKHCQENKMTDKHLKNINDVTGLLIGKKCSDGVATMLRHFDFLEFKEYEIKTNIDIETQRYSRNAKSQEKDFERATHSLIAPIKALNEQAEQEEREIEEWHKKHLKQGPTEDTSQGPSLSLDTVGLKACQGPS